MNLKENWRALLRALGEGKKMVLATAKDGQVSARMMSFVILDGLFYFQTDRAMRKYRQMEKNPNAALCEGNLQIEGICRELGHPLEDKTFCEIYKRLYPGSFELYTALPSERLFVFEPTYAKRWFYEGSVPLTEEFDFIKETYLKEVYRQGLDG